MKKITNRIVDEALKYLKTYNIKTVNIDPLFNAAVTEKNFDVLVDEVIAETIWHNLKINWD